MGAVIIGLAIVALILNGVLYYLIIPVSFNLKGTFEDKVTDPGALAFGDVLYDIIGIFILLVTGAVFLNAYQKSTRQSSLSQFG